ncbi:hypothetical protein G6F70_005450 [Rhizopus microsporus]|uniref:Uncharacterized protein n=2 Tax=Rhizopus TaxID=4842 RepID=A0A367KH78_RHIAZ|nr:hypothetical protein G6F71_005685 [Rhizopus microsporus]RCI01574.1 hypothetical protein CU097_015606 [Rhizopus azygosporus]KAG1198833.1 hypothetical protein G6F70_005450 [Rhizopus microsporus]KAG1210249.1 hypothetical protein G6F69_005636 [Rhizopus microsporus]KAG1231733.1 hypothetical protein G6F67_005538 [Rhizopus microsporus]
MFEKSQTKEFQNEHNTSEARDNTNFNSTLTRPTPTINEPQKPPNRRLSFALDEASLRNLKHQKMPFYNKDVSQGVVRCDDDQEEDMFYLDEEIPEDEEEKEENSHQNTGNITDKSKDVDEQSLLSASFRKSVSEIDQKYPWIKKKNNTSKYLQDFDIKKDVKNNNEEEETAISTYATSVPITINYFMDDNEENDKENKPAGQNTSKDILAKSFANYDFSYSDRLLSEQFPAPRRRKSYVPGSSVINPQLHSLVGNSLNTGGSLRKNSTQIYLKDEEEEEEDFDPSVPPHVWAAMEAKDDAEFIDHSYNAT